MFSNINSSYHALVAEIENKTSKRIQYDINYTWSHALDFNQNESTTTLGNGAFDPYNIDGYAKGANYGNSSFNVPQRLVAWALINSPNIQRNGWLKWAVNDWSLNPVYQAQNGLPYSATIGNGYPSYSAYGSSWNGAGTNYWIPSIGRNTFQMPRTQVVDMKLEKQFSIEAAGKPYHLQLVGEFFNVANHTNVTGVSSTRVQPRIQLVCNERLLRSIGDRTGAVGVLNPDFRSQDWRWCQCQRLWIDQQRRFQLCLQAPARCSSRCDWTSNRCQQPSSTKGTGLRARPFFCAREKSVPEHSQSCRPVPEKNAA